MSHLLCEPKNFCRSRPRLHNFKDADLKNSDEDSDEIFQEDCLKYDWWILNISSNFHEQIHSQVYVWKSGKTFTLKHTSTSSKITSIIQFTSQTQDETFLDFYFTDLQPHVML